MIGVIALAIAVVPGSSEDRKKPTRDDGPDAQPEHLRGNADVTRLLEIIEEKDINVLSLRNFPSTGSSG